MFYLCCTCPKKQTLDSLKVKRLKCHFVPPTGIEPISPEPESAILSIELQGHRTNALTKVQLFRIYYKFFAFSSNHFFACENENKIVSEEDEIQKIQ